MKKYRETRLTMAFYMFGISGHIILDSLLPLLFPVSYSPSFVLLKALSSSLRLQSGLLVNSKDVRPHPFEVHLIQQQRAIN